MVCRQHVSSSHSIRPDWLLISSWCPASRGMLCAESHGGSAQTRRLHFSVSNLVQKAMFLCLADHRAHSELRPGLATGRAAEFLVARLRAPRRSSSPTTHPHQPTVPELTCSVRKAIFEAIWSGPNATDRKTEFQRIKMIT